MNDHELRELNRYKEKRARIDNIIEGLTNAEKSEFSKRLKEVWYARVRQIDLISTNNSIQKNREEFLKKKDNYTLIGAGVVFVAMVVNLFFGGTIDDKNAIFALIIFVYFSLKYSIADTEHVIQYRLFDMEIKRLDADISRYGTLFSLDEAIDTTDVSSASDEIQNKFRLKKQNAYCNLEEEILASMCLISRGVFD